tara:strand:+ start:160 stop:375 length:216 start_codon:yes stop_codon:yes gene_type:complete
VSLEYVKRLRELRRLDYVEEPTEINKDSLMQKPNNKIKEVDKNPIQKFQENAFLHVMLINDRLKEASNDTV